MNAEDISRIKEKLNEIEKIDIAKIAVEKYQNQDIKDIILAAGFSVVQTITFLKRLVVQFNSIFEDEDSLILPNVFTFNEYDSPSGQNNVLGYLNHIIVHVETKNFDEISKSVRWLIAYQMNFGFWNQSEKRVHDVKVLKLNEKKEEIEILLEQVNNLKEQYNTLKINVEKEKDGLNTFLKLKQEELQTITNTLGKVSNEATEINSFWQNATKLDSEINSIKASWNESLTDLKKQKNEQQDKFDDFSKTNDEEIERLSELIKQTEEKEKLFIKQLGFIESKKSFIEEKEKEIIKLTGFAADGSLGHTFNSRQLSIGRQVRLWFWAIPVMSIVCLVYVFLMFYFSSNGTEYWINVLINTVKTIPAFILLYFVIRQYSKERNLQEEYAFKASVAMTLKAYADQLGNEGDTEKRKMLITAIDKLYTSPKISNETSGLFRFRSKSLNDTLKTLLEFLQQTVKK